MRLWSACLELFYPETEMEGEILQVEAPFCEQCGEPYGGELPGQFRCSNCHGREWSVGKARAPYLAEGAVREVIHQFKYEQKFFHLRKLGGWLVEGYERFFEAESYDALVPVPLYPLRRRERGFNQAEKLARYLGRRKGVPVWNCLKRIRATEIQARLRKSQRLRNQAGAYVFNSAFDVEGRALLIIDDVFTTGASTNACAIPLRRAGARSVNVLTVARG